MFNENERQLIKLLLCYIGSVLIFLMMNFLLYQSKCKSRRVLILGMNLVR